MQFHSEKLEDCSGFTLSPGAAVTGVTEAVPPQQCAGSKGVASSPPGAASSAQHWICTAAFPAMSSFSKGCHHGKGGNAFVGLGCDASWIHPLK